MLHLQTALTNSARTDIEARLTGRFYTPALIADRLASATPAVSCPESVCDPFCGDGRLVLSWLRHQATRGSLKSLRRIGLWELDGRALSVAVQSVQTELTRLGAGWVEVDAREGDSFDQEIDRQFEVVITNPPWEQLKPDSRDEVVDSPQYSQQIKVYARHLAQRFPSAAACKRRTIGGYTVNLARAGAILATRLTADRGILLIVLPSTIFGDQVSAQFRREFLSNVRDAEFSYYPAEAKIFANVDQSFVTVVARTGEQTGAIKIRRYRPDLSLSDERSHIIGSLDAPLPLAIGGKEHDIVKSLQMQHPAVTWLEDDLRFGLKLGRELDETRIADSFTNKSNGIPFVKGRNISRFGNAAGELPRVDPHKRKMPTTITMKRLAWRDVSRPSQKRRVHATLIAPGYVTGNSLGIATFSGPQTNLLAALLATVNSLVFEVQVRGALATNHVSQGVLRKCAVPYRLFEDSDVRSSLATLNRAVGKDPRVMPRMESTIARAYGVGRDDFADLLCAFDKIEGEERASLLDKEAWA